MDPAFGAVLGCASGAVLLAWLYFRRYRVTRPPLGVVNLWDIAIMLGAIVVVPYLYLLLPLGLVAGLLAAGYLSVLYAAAEPVLRAGRAIWPAVLALLAADVGAAHLFGPASLPFFAVNNVVLVAVVVGVANLWAQSGLKARDAAVLGGALAVYDLVATSFLPVMTDLVTRLAEIPFAPLVAWPTDGEGHWLGIGLGDLLQAAVFPLVQRRAFGERAGVVALAAGLAALGGMLAVVYLRVVPVGLPAMVVLGPLMVLQYTYWSRRRGGE
ncbi:MAG TPA: hypothetical protein VFM54_13410, partial [Micromonosporaceae bacterium]|nr:hypothetical protein [Micromonosporaceae bacterium]